MRTFVIDANLATIADVSGDVDFYLGFAMQMDEIDDHIRNIAKISETDPVVWIAYPKKSSRTYTCEFNRDSGWDGLGEIGFEPVRQVAINDDWSALRFRRVQHIKTMVRTFAMTEEGKRKATSINVGA
jgi:hypothetical protein